MERRILIVQGFKGPRNDRIKIVEWIIVTIDDL